MSSRAAAIVLLSLGFAGCRRDINHDPIRIAVTGRVSVNSAGTAANLESTQPSVSPDGRFVAFVSPAVNLTSIPTNGKRQVYVRDQLLGTTTLVSMNDAGDAADDHCDAPSISADGTRIVFHTFATNLVLDDTNFMLDVYLRDTALGQTTRVSLDDAGQELTDNSQNPAISADGKFVAFDSFALDVANVPSSGRCVFRRELATGKVRLVSIISGGFEPDAASRNPSISADGRYIAFVSSADDMTGPPAIQQDQVYRRDMTLTSNAVVAISVSTDPLNVPPNDISDMPSISADGQVIAFRSLATNLVADDLTALADIFVRDLRGTPTTTLVSRNASGNLGDDDSTGPALSADGLRVAYYSQANNLAPNVSGSRQQAYWHNRPTGETLIVSTATGGTVGNADCQSDSDARPAITGDGRSVFFSSASFNLIPFDVNGVLDIFVRGPLY